MCEHEQLDLKIILEVLKYLQLREKRLTRNNGDIALIAEIVRKLAAGVNIQSLSSNQTIQFLEAFMNDQYNVGQAGVAGPNSMVIGQNFTQIWSKQEKEINLDTLAQELRIVRDKGRASTSGAPEEDMALAELAKAEIAAKEGDGPKALGHLAQAGQWALRIAVAIGVPVASEALKRAMGI